MTQSSLCLIYVCIKNIRPYTHNHASWHTFPFLLFLPTHPHREAYTNTRSNTYIYICIYIFLTYLSHFVLRGLQLEAHRRRSFFIRENNHLSFTLCRLPIDNTHEDISSPNIKTLSPFTTREEKLAFIFYHTKFFCASAMSQT